MIRVTSGTCVRPFAGEDVAGDACLVQPWSRGVLLAVSDGLGHGPAAAEASRAFVAVVRASIEAPLEQIFSDAHRGLLKTRGAVAAIARFDEGAGKVEVAGLGNVTTWLARAGASPTYVPVPAGVLGGSYRSARPQSFDFSVGDLLLMHTDGIRSRFDLAPLRALSPDRLARAMVATYGKASDDAACAIVVAAPAGASAQGGRGEGGDHDDHGERDEDGERDQVAIAIRRPGDAECCAVGARAFAGRCGFTVRRQWEVSIAVSELATNVLKYADEGTLTLSRAMGPPSASSSRSSTAHARRCSHPPADQDSESGSNACTE